MCISNINQNVYEQNLLTAIGTGRELKTDGYRLHKLTCATHKKGERLPSLPDYRQQNKSFQFTIESLDLLC